MTAPPAVACPRCEYVGLHADWCSVMLRPAVCRPDREGCTDGTPCPACPRRVGTLDRMALIYLLSGVVLGSTVTGLVLGLLAPLPRRRRRT